MKKGRSNQSSLPASGMGLPKTAILRGRNHFKRLFEGAVTVHSTRSISLRYYTCAERRGDCKMGFIVAKRLGNAVKRNYIKRILREVYRTNRHRLVSTVGNSSVGFYAALSAKTINMDLEIAEKEINNLLDRTISDLHATRDL